MKYEFFKEQYTFHIEQRESLLNTLSFLMIPYGLLIAATVYYLTIFCDYILPLLRRQPLLDTKLLITLVLLTASTSFIALTGYYMIRAFHNFTYEYLPLPEDIGRYYKDLEKYHAQYPGNGTLDEDFKNFLTSAYISASARNSKNNKTRRRFCHLASRALIYSIIFIVITFIPLISFRTAPSVQKIEIKNKTLEVIANVRSEHNERQSKSTRKSTASPTTRTASATTRTTSATTRTTATQASSTSK